MFGFSIEHRLRTVALFAALAVMAVLVGVFALAGAKTPTSTAAPEAASASAPEPGSETAVFAGGCFWCVESDFDGVPGVLATVSGFTGGRTESPTYENVTHGRTGHREAVEVRYDPSRVSYAELVEVFWRSVDPTDGGGQFCDRGESYTTAIFAASDAQRGAAEASKARLERAGTLARPIATRIEPAGEFYPAAAHHQDYYRKNPLRYKLYRLGCGRDARIVDLWGDEAHRGIEKR